MPVETPSVFAHVIQEHLELKRRNSELDSDMPLERYEATDPFENHPLFKTEEQARIEETMDGEESIPADLVKITYFTTDGSAEALKLSREIRARKLGDANPSSTYLVIAGLAGPDLKVEIEGEAVAAA